MKISTLYADILVVGGGSAGIMAALRAKEVNPDQRVVVFEKGHTKYSGCIPRGMDALNIVTVPGVATPEDYVDDAVLGCEGILDEGPSYEMAKRSWPLMQKLIEWGVCFPKYDGQYEVVKAHAKKGYTVTMKEPNLKTILYERLQKTDCIIVNRTMALEFLVQDGRVAGAIGMNVRTGEIIVCYAKAVIVSAGGCARFGLPSNGYLYGVYDCPANTGDGYNLAYRAGAELTGLEYTLHYYIIKDISSPLLYITLTRGAQLLLNAFDERLDFGHPSIKSMIGEHQEGKGYMRIRMSHLPEEKIKSIEDILFDTEKPACQRFFEGRGINFRSNDIELGPTETYLCGGHGITGIVVNEKAEASIAGLYAAGDVVNVGRGHLTEAFVFGEIAAESASEYVKTFSDNSIDSSDLIDKVTDKINKWQHSEKEVSIEEFEYKTRRLISEYLTAPKNEYKLNRGIESMQIMQKELFEKVRIDRVHDLVKAFEVESIISCGILSATASKERKESRWGFWHYRSDYPEKDNKNFLKLLIVKKDGESDTPVVTLRNPQKVLNAAGNTEGRISKND